MILLSSDYLLFELESGERVPFSADKISVELAGDQDAPFDADFLEQATKAVFHFFQHELGRDTVTLGEFSAAMGRVLRHLMSVPIMTADKESIGGILVLSPYSNRLWSAEDQAFLANIATSLVPIIQRGQKMHALEHRSELRKQELDIAQARINDLERHNSDLIKQMEAVKADASEGLAQAASLAELTRMQEEAQKAIDKLKAENETLRASKGIKAGSKVNTQVEAELQSTLKEVARLQNQLAEANIKITETEKGSTAAHSTEQGKFLIDWRVI